MVAARKVRWAIRVNVQARSRRVTRALRLVGDRAPATRRIGSRLRKVHSYWWRNSRMVRRLGKMRRALWAKKKGMSFR